MELMEPEVTARRGNFHVRYAADKATRTPNQTGFRLLDLKLSVAPFGDPEYHAHAMAGEFCVVDVVTREKGWFEMPHGCTPDMVTGMVASTFNATAYRVGPKMWFV
jgi:hypothetical protein